VFVVLLAGAGTLLASLIALQRANTGYNMRQVLAIDVPGSAPGVDGVTSVHLLQEAVAPGCRALGSCDSPVRGRGESQRLFEP